jgi:hypothetical protein
MCLILRPSYVLFAAVMIATGCQSGGSDRENTELAALKAEPVAAIRPTGGRLVLDVESDADTSSKPIAARIFRVFAFDTSRASEGGLYLVMDRATASGWTINRNRKYAGDPYFGRKTLGVGPATLTIARYIDDGVPKLSVKLERIACPPELCDA